MIQNYFFIINILTFTLKGFEIHVENFRDALISINLVNKFKNFNQRAQYETTIQGNFMEQRKIFMALMDLRNLRLDLSLQDYYEVDKNKLFGKSIDIEIIITSYSPYPTVLYTYTKSGISVRDNSYLRLYNEDHIYFINVNIVYRCHGFTGYNCHIEMPKHPGWYVHPLSQKLYCPDKSKCFDIECDDKKYCENGGKCYKYTFSTEQKYCVCTDKYYGNRCQTKFIPKNEMKIYEDDLLFMKPSDIPHSNIREDCYVCKTNRCVSFGEYNVCILNTNDEDIKNCDNKNCYTECGSDICYMEMSNDVIYYFKDFNAIQKTLFPN